MDLAKIVEGVRRFEQEAHALLGKHEDSGSRVVVLSSTYARLEKLNIRQDDLMRQALRCTEMGLFRAAHVMAWAAFMDFYEERLASDGLVALKACREKWSTSSLDDLRESVAEHQLVEVGRPIGLLTKNDVKALHGLLNKRNECAHPSDYFPELNDTLGFISELLQRIEKLSLRTLSVPSTSK